MWRLLKWLFTGDAHTHHWTIETKSTWERNGRSQGHMYTLQCSKCGNIKQKKTEV